ncbi:hypothetical protein [Candidatus Nitrosocosmicus sp. SS]|jgi:hypothetical protein|uniref:hypothetical protein n=1 Tax=Candidatus Nitrosocosmicus agrestis TaxID=2563600 RepID=UPI00122E2A33|nr:hypothetical protein [Candidatus Nitrosocosmicus sp. SS]KAA2279399.1 hypothetical protein F1Z66_13500 [Candidatus Nitrosocosmicus sp. SS]KAF0868087.1 hypothetical protein E5N71_12040 [Candidatus Nitrosocosmicus sp. SS]
MTYPAGYNPSSSGGRRGSGSSNSGIFLIIFLLVVIIMIGYTIYNATRPITYPSAADFMIYHTFQLDAILSH